MSHGWCVIMATLQVLRRHSPIDYSRWWNTTEHPDHCVTSRLPNLWVIAIIQRSSIHILKSINVISVTQSMSKSLSQKHIPPWRLFDISYDWEKIVLTSVSVCRYLLLHPIGCARNKELLFLIQRELSDRYSAFLRDLITKFFVKN